MADIRGKQFLIASKLVLSIATGGLLAVNHRLEECPIYVAAMYLLMNFGFLLVGLSASHWKQGSTTASMIAFGYESAKRFSSSGKLLLCVGTGGLLVVTEKPMDEFPYFAAAILLYLLMTVGFLLLWLSLVLRPFGYTAAATAGDGSR